MGCGKSFDMFFGDDVLKVIFDHIRNLLTVWLIIFSAYTVAGINTDLTIYWFSIVTGAIGVCLWIMLIVNLLLKIPGCLHNVFLFVSCFVGYILFSVIVMACTAYKFAALLVSNIH
jgi:hypothetical protein